MTYPASHVLVTFGGTAPGNEIWQCGFRLAYLSGAVPKAAFDTLDPEVIGGHIQTMITAGTTGWVDDIAYRWTKLALVDPAGEYSAEPRVWETPLPVVGTISNRQSLATAYAVTLWSGQTLGRANYGRFYLPQLGWNRANGSGGVAPSAIAGILGNVRTMLAAVRGYARIAPANLPFELVVASKLGNGTFKPVTQVRMGCVPDTQRRRRNKLDENPQVLPFPS